MTTLFLLLKTASLGTHVNVARRIDNIDDIRVIRLVGVVIHQTRRLQLNCDAPLALQVHCVEVLGLHLAPSDSARLFEQPVGDRRLAVVNVGDNRAGTNSARRDTGVGYVAVHVDSLGGAHVGQSLGSRRGRG